MTTERWVVLLRGVNVNGVKVTSAALREVCGGLGLERVRTVRASGNVVVDVPGDGVVGVRGCAGEAVADGGARGAGLKTAVEGALRDRFGYEAFVVVLPVAALRRVCAAWPFERDDETHHPYVVFASDRAALDALDGRARDLVPAGGPDAADGPGSPGTGGEAGSDGAAAGGGGGERLHRGDGVLYWRCPKGSSTDTPFARLLGAAHWRPSVTTRTLRTLAEVLAAAEG